MDEWEKKRDEEAAVFFGARTARFMKRYRPKDPDAAEEFDRDLTVVIQDAWRQAQQPFAHELSLHRSYHLANMALKTDPLK